MPVEVVTDGKGAPVTVEIATVEGDGDTAGRRHGEMGTQTHAGHRIIEVLETWRIDDEWWREPISRRYFDVVLEGGGHVVLFEDLIAGSWFLQQP